MNITILTFALSLFSILLINFSNSDVDGVDNNNDQNNGEYYIKAKINGEEVVADYQPHMNTLFGEFPEGRFSLGMDSSMPDETGSGSKIVFGILLFDMQSIGVGNYQDGRWEEFGVYGNLYVGIQLSYMNLDLGFIAYVTYIEEPQADLHITEFTEQHIRGTFSGTVFEPVTNASLSITEGEFYIKRND